MEVSAMFIRGSLSWKKFISLSCAMYFLSTSSAFADTYNLYFKKAGPGKDGVEEISESEKPTKAESKVDSGEAAEAKAETEKRHAEQEALQAKELAEKTATEAAEKSKAAADKEQTKEAAAEEEARHSSRVVIPNDVRGAPTTIIINNNMSSPTPAAVVAPPVKEPEAPPVINPAPEVARRDVEPRAITYVPVRPSALHMMFSGSLFASQVDAPWQSNFGSHITPGVGLLVTLGIDLVGGLSVNGWGGISPVSGPTRFHGGVDLEYLPFRLNMGSYNLLELGLLAGVSTLSYNRTSDLGPVHLGGRFNLNFNEYFGLTTSLRANQTFVMWEGGLIVRI
jgi:hypothetical protein